MSLYGFDRAFKVCGNNPDDVISCLKSRAISLKDIGIENLDDLM